MAQEKEYFAFISYQRKDEEWADRLRKKLEHYRLPSNVRKQDASLPKEIRPIFRDSLELAGGVLAKEIETALQQSKYLIVICSPNSAKSPWVNKEIQTFIDLGREDRIIPFIIDGTPFSDNEETECFPPALLSLKGEKELLGININELSRDSASIKVVARMFGLKFDTLWQRFEREKKRRRWIIIGGALLFALVSLGIGGYIAKKNRELDFKNKEIAKERDRANSERDRANSERNKAEAANVSLLLANDSIKRQYELIQLQKNQIATERDNVKNANHAMQVNLSRILAEKANKLVDEGDSYLARLIALQALPPHRPYTVEAEAALRKACEAEFAILRGHRSNVLHITNNIDGNFVTTSSDGTMKVWNLKNGNVMNTWNQKGWCDFSAYNPNGKYFVSAQYKFIFYRNPLNGEITDTLIGHSAQVNSISFNKNGDKMVSTSQDQTVIIWNTQVKKPIFHLKGHSSFTKKAVFSPDGKYIASGSWDNTIIIWNAQTGDSITTLKGHSGYVEDVDYSPDGKYIASASQDNTVIIWDAINGERVHTLSKHTKQVNSVKYNKDGTLLVSASKDGTVMLWDPLSGNHIKTFMGHTDYVHHAIFSSDDKHILSASRDMTVRVWDVYNEEEYDTLGKYVCSFMVCINEDGSNIALLPNYTPNIYDLNSSKFLFALKGHDKSVHDIVFSPSGNIIATASHDGSIKIWNSHNGNLLYTLPSEKISLGEINTLAFSPEGNFLVSGQNNGSLIIWDVDNKKMKQKIKGHIGKISSLAFFPNGERFLSASSDGKINVWDSQTGSLHKSLDAHTAKVHSLAISRHGDFFVSGSVDKKIIIWDVKSLSPRKIIDNHNSTVYSVAISRDDKYIVSAHVDKKVRVWDSASGFLFKSFDACTTQNGLVTQAIFNKNVDKIIIASEREGVKIFDFPPLQQLINETRERFKDRQLTPEERRKYYLE